MENKYIAVVSWLNMDNFTPYSVEGLYFSRESLMKYFNDYYEECEIEFFTRTRNTQNFNADLKPKDQLSNYEKAQDWMLESGFTSRSIGVLYARVIKNDKVRQNFVIQFRAIH